MSLRSLFAALVLFCFFSLASATSDETAMGRYSYRSQAFSVDFVFDLDGVKNVRINGRSYPGIFQTSESGRHDGTAVYTAVIEDKRNRSKNLQLVILFDSDDAVRAVAGFYFEQVQSATSGKLENVRVFKPTFNRIPIEKLPSSRVTR